MPVRQHGFTTILRSTAVASKVHRLQPCSITGTGGGGDIDERHELHLRRKKREGRAKGLSHKKKSNFFFNRYIYIYRVGARSMEPACCIFPPTLNCTSSNAANGSRCCSYVLSTSVKDWPQLYFYGRLGIILRELAAKKKKKKKQCLERPSQPAPD